MLLISFDGVIKIADKNNNLEFTKSWQAFKKNDLVCHLAKSVRCYNQIYEKSPNDYIIHCNSHYKSNRKGVFAKPKNICDFIEVKWIDDNDVEATSIARFIAIFSFHSKDVTDKTEQIFLLICWMKKKTINKSVLPYCSYGYDFANPNQLYLQIVSIDNMIRPAFLISHSHSHSLLWSDLNQYTDMRKLKEQLFYIIPYENVVRDHCDSFVEFDKSGDYTNSSTEDGIFNDMPAMLSKNNKKEIARMMTEIYGDSNNNEDYCSDDSNSECDDR